MELSIKIILDRTTDPDLQNSYRGTYYYGKISVPLPDKLDIHTYYSNRVIHWFNNLTIERKNKDIWETGIVRFVKKWQKGEIDFRRFYSEVVKKIIWTGLRPCNDLYRKIPIEYVLAIFPIADSYRGSGNCKWRSPLSILNIFFDTIVNELTEMKIYPGGFIGRKPEISKTESLWQEFNLDVDLGERGEGLLGYWKRILESPVVDTSRRVIELDCSQDVDSFEYFFLQKLKFAYVIYKVFPEYFSKMYPSA